MKNTFEIPRESRPKGKNNPLERKRDRGKTYEQLDPQDERLALEESLVYQDYASKKEGLPFSEKASIDSYREARIFLNILEEKQFNLDGIDLSKFDFNNLDQIQEVEKRLDSALKSIYQNKGKCKDSKLNQILAKTKGIVLPLVFSSFILSAGLIEKSQATELAERRGSTIEKQVSEKEMMAERVIISKDKSHLQFQKDFVIDWIVNQEKLGIQIDKVIINRTGSKRIKKGGENPYYDVEGDANITVIIKNGPTLVLEGRAGIARFHEGDIFRWLSIKIEEAIKKSTGKEVTLTDYATQTNEMRVQALAVLNALDQFDYHYKNKDFKTNKKEQKNQHRGGDK